jgi:hypothetical protein
MAATRLAALVGLIVRWVKPTHRRVGETHRHQSVFSVPQLQAAERLECLL